MKKAIVLMFAAILSVSASAGVVKSSAKAGKFGVKKAAHYSAKAGKVVKRVLY